MADDDSGSEDNAEPSASLTAKVGVSDPSTRMNSMLTKYRPPDFPQNKRRPSASTMSGQQLMLFVNLLTP